MSTQLSYYNLLLACLRKSAFVGLVWLWACFHGFAQVNPLDIENLKRTLANCKTDAERLPILNDLADLYAELNLDSAKRYAEKSYQIHQKADKQREMVRAIALMGVALQKTKTPEREIRIYFEKALKLAEKLKEDELLGYVWHKFGDFCNYRGNLDDAITHYEQARVYYTKCKKMHGLQNTYHRMATVYNQQGKPQKSLDMYLQALKILRDQKRENTTGILSDIGNVYFNQGNFIEALHYYQEGLQASKKQQDIYSQGFCLNNIGMVHNSLGNHDEALQYHLEALKKREQAHSEEGVSNSYSNIGQTYMQLGYYEKGREYIKKSLDIDRKLGNQQTIAMDFDFIGTALLNDKKYEEALQQFQEGLKIRLASGQVVTIGMSYAYMGMVYTRKKEYPTAIGYLNKADSIFTLSEAHDFLTANNLRLARVYFELGTVEKSEIYAQKALQSALKRKTKPEIIEASQVLAQIYAQKGNYQRAYTLQNQALAYKDSLTTEERNRKVLRMQALFEFKQQEKNMVEKDRENRRLKNDKAHQENELLLYYILMLVSFGSLGALVVIAYFLWKVGQKNALKTKQLALQNEEIILQAEEIMAQHQAIEAQNNELQTTHKNLSEANQELIDSIAYAHRIQKAVLPTQEEIYNALPVHFILYKPRNVVSGDFYWFSNKERQTVMAVMDCTGHGIPGAFMSLIGNDLLHEIVNLREIIEPSQILTELKKRVNSSLKQHTTKGRDGMDIGICVIDHEPTQEGVERKLYFAAAHLSLIYFQDRQQKELEGSKIYIGGYDPDETEKFFETKTLVLDRPTACYLFSDGFQDQFAENSRKKFTKKRLKAILTDVHLQIPEIQHEILEETIEEWKGEAEQTDDIIVFGVCI